MIDVTYDVVVRRGSVSVDVWRPLTPWSGPERLGGVTLRETRRGTLEITVEESLRYDIRTKPVWFGGSYDVAWDVR